MKDHSITSAEQDPITAWLTRQYETVEGGHRPEVVALFHLNHGDQNVPLDRHQIPSHTPEAAQRMAAQLRFRARADAETRGGHERYSIAVHWPTDADVEPCFHLFAVDGMRVRTSDMDTPTEPANLAGVTKQLMRHTEMLLKVAVGQHIDNQRAAQEREQMLLERLKVLEEGRLQVVEMTEGLLSAHAERELAQTKAQNAERRKDEALKELLPLAKVFSPKLLEAVSGQKAEDGNGMAVLHMFRGMFEGLSVEQMKATLATLPPDKQAHFLHIYRASMNLPKQPDDAGDAAADEPTH